MNKSTIPPWNETVESLRNLWALYWDAREERSLFGSSSGIYREETKESLRIKATIKSVTQAITAREERLAATLREMDAIQKAALTGVERALRSKTVG